MIDAEMQLALEADAEKLSALTGEDHRVFFCDAPCENEVHGCKELCCCGDYIEGHDNPMNCGHSPVSMHDYYCSACDTVVGKE